MTEIVIIADDLSGGTAVGAEFSRHGFSVAVAATIESIGFFGERCEALVVNTDTRNRAPGPASDITRRAAAKAVSLSPSIVLKKFDSLLRGSIGEEIDALLSTFDEERCLVVAASPAVGRTTVNGIQYLHGRQISEVLEEADPSARPIDGSLPMLLRGSSRRVVHELPLALVELGEDAIFRSIAQAGHGLFAADATSEENLEHLVRAARRAGISIFAGTYGLGAPLAMDRTIRSADDAPVLVIAGSLSTITRRQAEVLGAEDTCSRVALDLRDAQSTRIQIERALHAGRDVVLTTAADPGEARILAQKAAEDGTAADLEQTIAHALYEACAPMLAVCRGIVISGGSTGACLISSMGADGLELEAPGEVLPGMPFCRLAGGPHAGLGLLIKPGTYGGPGGLAAARNALRRITRRGVGCPDYSSTPAKYST